jgi:hypothetical protein
MTMMQQAVAGLSGRKAFRDRIPRGAVERAGGLGDPLGALKTLGLITVVGMTANFAMPINSAQANGDFSRTCWPSRLRTVRECHRLLR